MHCHRSSGGDAEPGTDEDVGEVVLTGSHAGCPDESGERVRRNPRLPTEVLLNDCCGGERAGGVTGRKRHRIASVGALTLNGEFRALNENLSEHLGTNDVGTK